MTREQANLFFQIVPQRYNRRGGQDPAALRSIICALVKIDPTAVGCAL